MSPSLTKSYSLGGLVTLGFFCILLLLILIGKLDSARQKYNGFRKQLDSYREAIWKTKDVNLKEMNQDIQRASQLFASSDKLALVIGELTDKAGKHDVKLRAVSPSEKTDLVEDEKKMLPDLKRIRFNMRLEGSYENLSSFLSELNHLENGLIRCDRFNLGKQSENGSVLNLNLEASLYVKPRSDWDIFSEIKSDSAVVDANTNKQKASSRFKTFLRNPFAPPTVRTMAKSSINLEGILYDPIQPIALINGEAKKMGDQVGNNKIVDISPTRVLFQSDSGQFELTLGSSRSQ